MEFLLKEAEVADVPVSYWSLNGSPADMGRTYITKVDLKKCIGCGICAKVCPENCISMVKIKGETKQKTDYDYCKGCGICATECPVKAIEMELEKK